MKAQNRLPAETVNLDIGGWKLAVSIARSTINNEVREIVFVERAGKAGSELDEKFHELGVQLSRAIQGRDPLTGEEVRGDPL
jgi:hypothetical protein|tara:strand:+ start:377 stop:622 length:246 start_codon:yes stop_codon:yes gene_type:complete